MSRHDAQLRTHADAVRALAPVTAMIEAAGGEGARTSRAMRQAAGTLFLRCLLKDPEHPMLRFDLMQWVLRRRFGASRSSSDSLTKACRQVARQLEGAQEDKLEAPSYPPEWEHEMLEAGTRLRELLDSELDIWGNIVLSDMAKPFAFLITAFKNRLHDRMGPPPGFVVASGANEPASRPAAPTEASSKSHHLVALLLDALAWITEQANIESPTHRRAYSDAVEDVLRIVQEWRRADVRLPFVLRKLFPSHAWPPTEAPGLAAWTQRTAAEAWEDRDWPAAWSWLQARRALPAAQDWRAGYEGLAGSLRREVDFPTVDEVVILSARLEPPRALDSWAREVNSAMRPVGALNAEVEDALQARIRAIGSVITTPDEVDTSTARFELHPGVRRSR